MKKPLYRWLGRSGLSLSPPLLALGLLSATTGSTSAATHYVDLNSTSPSPPYTNWAMAARVIQQAVDAAQAGDEIIVTDGVYATGGRAMGTNLLVNRVAVDKPLSLRSVNGPQFTIIQGCQAPGTTNGDGAIRCVYLADGATLSGFTLTNGATRAWGESGYSDLAGGGLWCAGTNGLVSDCLLIANSAALDGGGVHSGILTGCTLIGNSAGAGSSGGGGAVLTILKSCTLTGNAAWSGGGAACCTLTDCKLISNAAVSGGAADGCSLTKCELTDNTADFCGGGALGGALDACILSGNQAWIGGGAALGSLKNCAVIGNTAGFSGGGVCQGVLQNCTLTGNSADSGGGVSAVFCTTAPELNNCIVAFNKARDGSDNYPDESQLWFIQYIPQFNFCCTTPLPPTGIGNIAADPRLAGQWQLSADSPCRGVGSPGYATGTDLDGEPWATPPSMGCDEHYLSTRTGPLKVSISANYTNVAVSYPVRFTDIIEGTTTLSTWAFGNGAAVTNRPYCEYTWSVPGDYPVTLQAFNQSHPEGANATITIHVLAQPVHYVAVSNAHPVPPYTSWETAATSIQDAVDAASVAGASVIVSNGVYGTGGRAVDGTVTNRLAVDKPLVVSSVNGPEFTVIQGYQVPGRTNGDGAIRCVYLGERASLVGFTLTNGATHGDDGDFPLYRVSSGGGV